MAARNHDNDFPSVSCVDDGENEMTRPYESNGS